MFDVNILVACATNLFTACLSYDSEGTTWSDYFPHKNARRQDYTKNVSAHRYSHKLLFFFPAMTKCLILWQADVRGFCISISAHKIESLWALTR